jgi:hypothetical protein
MRLREFLWHDPNFCWITLFFWKRNSIVEITQTGFMDALHNLRINPSENFISVLIACRLLLSSAIFSSFNYFQSLSHSLNALKIYRKESNLNFFSSSFILRSIEKVLLSSSQRNNIKINWKFIFLFYIFRGDIF